MDVGLRIDKTEGYAQTLFLHKGCLSNADLAACPRQRADGDSTTHVGKHGRRGSWRIILINRDLSYCRKPSPLGKVAERSEVG